MPTNESTRHYESVVRSLNALQKEILDWIWTEYRKTGKWPQCARVLHKFRSRGEPEEAISGLTGNLIRETDAMPESAYELTMLGILAAPAFADCREPLVRFFRFLQEHLTDENFTEMSHQRINVRQISQTTERELACVERFMMASDILRTEVQWLRGTIKVTLRKGLQELDGEEDPLRNLIAKALEAYDPELPVHRNERYVYWSDQVEVPRSEWTALNLELEAFRYWLRTGSRLWARIMSYAVFAIIALPFAVIVVLPFVLEEVPTSVRFAAAAVTAALLLIGFLKKKSIGEHRSAFEKRKARSAYNRKLAKFRRRFSHELESEEQASDAE